MSFAEMSARKCRATDKSDDDTFVFDENFSIENEKKDAIRNEFSIKYMTNVVNFFDEKDSTCKRKHSYRSVQRRFKRVKDRNYIRRFRIHIANNGTQVRKLNLIDSFVYEAFSDVRDKLLSVHDIDLKRWAIKKAKDLFDTTFTASDHWVRQFKIRHNIVSRKITKLVTKWEIDDSDKIHQSADEFVSNMQKISRQYSLECILNTDQCGLQLEMFSNRTLSHQGEKVTLSAVRSINDAKYSYTAQPIISMRGNLVGPLFLCLKEASGRLGDTVKKNLFAPSNIVLTCSKSGKLTSSLIEYWRDNVLAPVIKNKDYLLILDSWSAQRAVTVYKDFPNVKRFEIPKKTTGMIQPLDVYFNRQYKMIGRKLYEYVRLHCIDINLAQRNNIIKINSLMHNQLSSKEFNAMIKYA